MFISNNPKSAQVYAIVVVFLELFMGKRVNSKSAADVSIMPSDTQL